MVSGHSENHHAIFLQIIQDSLQVFKRSNICRHLRRKFQIPAVAPQKQLSAVHTSTGEIADDRMMIFL